MLLERFWELLGSSYGSFWVLLGTFVCFWELQVAHGQLLWELMSASGRFCVLLGSVVASVGASGSFWELLGAFMYASMYHIYVSHLCLLCMHSINVSRQCFTSM